MNAYLFLGIAIVCEVIGTSLLNKSESFTKLLPSLGVVAAYGAAFYCLTIVMRSMPIGVAYAIWSGVGTALITLVGIVVFKQKIDLAGVLGIALIVSGVVVLNVFSKVSAH